MKNIVILGSTGSIGTQTLDIVREHRNEFTVTALAADGNIDRLEEQIREFAPSLVCVYREDRAIELRERIRDLSIKVVTKMDGLIECATQASAHMIVTAMVGMIGITPTIEAIKAGKDIALANKETLVTAGHIIMPMLKEKQVNLLPVDSEHSAVFQALQGEESRAVHRIILTASGGPFRGRQMKELDGIRPEDALKHPNWAMGNKITIDSATMVNKGLEVMEARWLFGVEMNQIQVLVHPQSIIHSMVEYVDGSVIAQLGLPDMRLPIQYALFYPKRMSLEQTQRLDLVKLGSLTFEAPDLDTFYGLKLAIEAGTVGGSMPTVYNAANEWAVARFLEKQIGFLDIPMLIGEAMKHHKLIEDPALIDILNTEQETYDFMKDFIQG